MHNKHSLNYWQCLQISQCAPENSGVHSHLVKTKEKRLTFTHEPPFKQAQSGVYKIRNRKNMYN